MYYTICSLNVDCYNIANTCIGLSVILAPPVKPTVKVPPCKVVTTWLFVKLGDKTFRNNMVQQNIVICACVKVG